jgi:carbamate kinase
VTGPVVVALGGNALAAGPGALDPDDQLRQLGAAVAAIAPLAHDHDLVVTHGNGPQVGMLAHRAAASGSSVALDVLDAQSEGLIGYSLVLALDNALTGREVVALLTRTLVDRHDPAFDRPTKPIGLPDAGGDRRLVASPEPLEILERESIARLVAAGVIVVCVGGGGIPVARGADGSLGGVEAVVDKDLASGLVATALGAGALLLLTDVDGVYEGWGTDAARRIDRTTPTALRAGGFPAGSMGPKAEAAARFVERGGGRAAIGALGDAAALLAGTAGTQVDAEPDDPRGGEATA